MNAALRYRGFLIVETFERQYEDFSKPWGGPGDFYGIPKKGVPASQANKRYRGIDREPLQSYSDEDIEKFGDSIAPRREDDCERFLAKLESREKLFECFIDDIHDAREAFSLVKKHQDYELIWARDYLYDEKPPTRAELLGYEPSWFGGDHFSAIADCMFLPRWHGPDKDGTEFRSEFGALSQHGLFNTPSEALAYLEHYRSFDWTETGHPWVLTEVWFMP